MEGKSDVLAVAILERDRHQDVMVTWSFPGLDAALEPVLIARSGLVVASADEAKGGGGALFGASGTGPALAFRWSKFGTHWHYIKPVTSFIPRGDAAAGAFDCCGIFMCVS